MLVSLVGAVPPDGCFDARIVFKLGEHVFDPGGFVAADAGAGKFGDHQRLLILWRHLCVEGIVDLVEAAPDLAVVIITGVVAGEADDVDVFIAWIIIVGVIPAEIREGFFVWIPHPEGYFCWRLLLQRCCRDSGRVRHRCCSRGLSSRRNSCTSRRSFR